MQAPIRPHSRAGSAPGAHAPQGGNGLRRAWRRWTAGSLALIAACTIAQAQVNVTATAGTLGASYTTVKGAFDAINAGTHQGVITLHVSASTTEPAIAVLNSSGAGSASYTSVLIRPSVDGVTISGATATGRGLLELNGADNVTIDGDNPNTGGTNRNLTVTNTAANTITYTMCVRVAVATTVVTSADNVIIRNLNVNGSATGRNLSSATSTTASENLGYGIYCGGGASTVSATTAPAAISSSTTTVGTGATMANLTISGNAVNACARGIAVQASATAVVNSLVVTNNIIGAATSGNATTVYSMGMTLQGFTAATVTGNMIRNMESYLGTAMRGIDLGSISASGTNALVARNTIDRVFNQNAGTFGAYGINVQAGNATTVQNNCVRDVFNSQTSGTGAFSTTFGAFGIRVSAATGHKVLHNTVHLASVVPGSISTNLIACLAIVNSSQTGMDVRNNIFANTVTGGNPSGFNNTYACLYLPSLATSAMNLTLNNNAYYQGALSYSGIGQAGATGGTNFYTAANFNPGATSPAANMRAYTSTLSVATTNDNASFATTSSPPLIGCGVDVSLPGAVTLNGTGASGTGVTDDLTGDPRGTPPDIGADEFLLTVCSSANGGTISPASQSACSGTTKVITATGPTTGVGISYQWEVSSTGGGVGFANVSGGSGATSTSYTTGSLSTGTSYYRLRVTCSNGPVVGYSNELTLTVDQTPSASASSNSPVCVGQTLNLTGGSDIGTNFSWTGPLAYASNAQSPQVSASATTTMAGSYVLVVSQNGCNSVPSSTNVVVNPSPTITSVTGTPNPICFNANSQLKVEAQGNAGYAVSSIPFAPVAGSGPAITNWTGGASGNADDGFSTAITIPFAFVFNGVTYTQVWVGTNGYITFLNPSTVPAANSRAPANMNTNALPNGVIALSYSDLHVLSGATVSTFTTGGPGSQIFVTSFNAVPFYVDGVVGTGNVTGQILLYEGTNVVEVHVSTVSHGTATFTNALGIENEAGSFRLFPAGHDPALNWNAATSEAWRFYSPVSGYLWTPNTFLSADNIANPMATGVNVASQTYTVTASNSLGCTDSETLILSTSDPITAATISGNLSYCATASTTLTALPSDGGGPFTYLWSPNGETTASIAVNTPGTYSCQVDDNCGGSVNTGGVSVTELPAPGGSISGPGSGVTYQTLTFTAAGSSGTPTFQWQTATAIGGPYANVGGNVNPIALVSSASGTYYVRCLITGGGCTTTSNVITVVITVAGDNVCSANPIVVGTNGPFTNVGATTQVGEAQPATGSCTGQTTWCAAPNGTISNSVWFSFVAPSSGRISLNFGTTQNWDSEIALWSAPGCGALLSGGGTQLAANDDVTGVTPYHAAITPICVTPGVTYYVQVDGYGTTTNNAFQLVLVAEAATITAAISAAPNPVCPGGSASVTFTGTSGATVSYSVDGGPAQNGVMTGGTLVVNTGALAAPTSYELLSVTSGSCTQVFTGQAITITIATVDDGDVCTLDACANGVVTHTFQDADGDLTCDANDGCPNDPGKTSPGFCGCGVAEGSCFDCEGVIAGPALPGTPCDDLDDCTSNDTWSPLCVCTGTFDDADGDSVCDADDICPGSNDLADADADAVPDGCDGCPLDPNKTSPGACGCGAADVDTDGDLVLDCFDLCPLDPLKTVPGLCGCGLVDVDVNSNNQCDTYESGAFVQLGVVEVPGNQLELRLLPDDDFDGLVSGTVITVRWLTTPGVSITSSSAQYLNPAYAPAVGNLQNIGTTTDGLYSYATFFTIGNGTLLDEGLGWTANVEVPFFRVPYVNTGNECVTFEVLDDTYQIDNNLVWFISLNADTRSSGYIPGKESVLTYPVAHCQNIIATLDVSGNVSITPEQINTSFVGCPPVSLSLDQSAFTCADLGANPVLLTATANSVISTCNATVTVVDADTDGDATNDCADGCPLDPNKTAPGLCGCGNVDVDVDGDLICDTDELEPNVKLGIVEAPGNKLELRLLPDHDFNDLVSGTVITIRWVTTAGVSVTGASAQYVDPGYTSAAGSLQYGGTTTNGSYSYATFFSIGSGLLYDDGISWTNGVEEPLFRVPYENTGSSCVSFEVVDDAYQSTNNYQWFISLNALDKTNGYIPGKTAVCASPTSLQVSARVILEGPWVGLASLMRDDVRAAGHVPAAHPYGPAPFSHGGSETVAPAVLAVTGSNAILDWILLELRSGVTPTSVVASRAALLQRDGDVVDLDGSSPVSFTGLPAGNYYLAVRHRNHLGIMTASGLSVTGATPLVDFSSSLTPTFGTDARKPVGSIMALWAGNVFADDRLKYTGVNNDRDPILITVGTPNATLTGYHAADVNMDDIVKYTGLANDRDPILVNIGGIPNNVRLQPLP